MPLISCSETTEKKERPPEPQIPAVWDRPSERPAVREGPSTARSGIKSLADGVAGQEAVHLRGFRRGIWARRGLGGAGQELYNPPFSQTDMGIFGKNWRGELFKSLSGQSCGNSGNGFREICRLVQPETHSGARLAPSHCDSSDTLCSALWKEAHGSWVSGSWISGSWSMDYGSVDRGSVDHGSLPQAPAAATVMTLNGCNGQGDKSLATSSPPTPAPTEG